MSGEEARAKGRKVIDDCRWVVMKYEALEEACRRAAEECERAHAVPLRGAEDALRRAETIATKVQAEQDRDSFLQELAKHDKRSPPLWKLRDRDESRRLRSHLRFRDRDLAIAAELGREALAVIAGPSDADRTNPPLPMVLFAHAIHAARRTIVGKPRRLFADDVPQDILDEAFDVLTDPEVERAWIGPPLDDERPGPSRASNLLVARLTGGSWTLVRDARSVVKDPTER